MTELKMRLINDKTILQAYDLQMPETDLTIEKLSEEKPADRKTGDIAELEPKQVSDVDVDIPQGKLRVENGVAVVIGNKNYQHPDIPDVDHAISDAGSMRNYLVAVLGYNSEDIIYVEDAGKADLETIFGIKGNPKGKLYSWIRPDKTDVFIYYSGNI